MSRAPWFSKLYYKKRRSQMAKHETGGLTNQSCGDVSLSSIYVKFHLWVTYILTLWRFFYEKKKGKREREEKRKKKVYSEVFDFSNTNFADLTFLCFLPFLYSLKNVIPCKYVCFFFCCYFFKVYVLSSYPTLLGMISGNKCCYVIIFSVVKKKRRKIQVWIYRQ